MFYWLDNFTLCFPPLFHQSMRSNLTSCTAFLIFYADLIKWADRLARHSQQTDMTYMGQSCGPRASGPCWAAVWPYIGVQRITLK
jgi:hypothetical protein